MSQAVHLLHSDLIYLREWEPGDLKQYNEWQNDPDVVDYLGRTYGFISTAVDEMYYQQYIKSREKNVRLAIVLKENDRYIGNVQLTNIHRTNQSAEFSIMIGPPQFRAKGIGSQATRLILHHGFHNLNLHRIYLNALEENEVAIKTYQKVGFQIEGKRREALFKNGRYVNLIDMSILATDPIL
ncbi:MAG: GNAT family N-acetyltransferase [Cyanobacteria bacterium]|nr:GNAT family N-acetyltransferase [Cyanobacteriota bacterium]